MLAIRKYIYPFFIIFYSFSLVNASPEYYFKQFSLKDGLSESMVKCVLTDHKGLIWIGTRFGLNAFDRERIKNYYHDKQNTHSIPDNNIIFLTEDSLRNLWVSTKSGLALYDRENDYFIPATMDGRPICAYSYVFAKGGLLFFGRGEFFRYDYSEKKILSMPVRSTENNQNIFEKACVYNEADGKILLASGWHGLWEYDMQSGCLQRSSFVKDLQISALLVDSSGYVWLSVYGKGLTGYDYGKKLICHVDASGRLSNGVILDIKEREGKLWLATDGGGINVYDKTSGAVTVMNHVPGNLSSLPVNSLFCLYNDPDNNMWAGSIRGGLIGMKEIYMKTYRDAFPNSSYGLSEKSVVGMYEDENNQVWLGTDGGGMNKLDPQTGRFTHYLSTYPSKIVSIIGYNSTKLLYSCFGEGLFLFDKQTGAIQEYPVMNRDKHEQLFQTGKSVHLVRLDNSRFYLLADSVYLYDQSTGKLNAVENEDKGLIVSSLGLIEKGMNVSYLRGETDLFELDYVSNTMKAIYSSADSIGIIEAACKDSLGHFWIGSTIGLFCYDSSGKILTPIESNRLKGITSLGFDGAGQLWIGTHNGLYAYLPREKKIMMFGESDGVFANEYISKSPLLTGNGDLYMAGMTGLVHIKNNISFTENQEPVIALLDVSLNGASVNTGNDDDNIVSVPWNYTSLVAKIIVRENDLMRKKLFRYYIKGTQQEMVESTNLTIAFHALAVGNYEVWVSCSKKNGDWSVPVKLLSVNVMPPWWRTTWFTLCCVLLALVVLASVFWLVIKRQKSKMIWAMKEHEQRTYEEKIRFLINLNHELRTPLTLIYSPLKRLLGSGEVTDSNQYRLLADILKQVHRVKAIIDMVLNVRKMETGRETLHIELKNLNEWIRLVSDTFKGELEYKKIRLEYQLDESIGEFPFDASKCEIVLSNLIMNAMKFSDEGTSINISSRLKKNDVCISVTDQGIGLSDADISHLFDRFYQGEHRHEGTGIGLSYARLLIEMQGGRIGAMNNADKGATFFYELPVNGVSARIEARPYLNELLVSSDVKAGVIADFSVRKYSVLIVEDEPELRNYLKSSLKEYFKQVYVAEDGEKAFNIVVRYQPDIVVSDVMMPCMDGYEFCRQLKSTLEVSHIPVILLTARADEDSAMQGYKEGADFYLPKPFDLEFLLAIIRNILKNREAVKLRYKDSREIVSPKEDTISNADEKFIRKLNDLINEHLDNPELDVNFVATHMAMSRASLYNKLKTLTNVSIGDYINKFRMARVTELLKNKDLSILEVSEKAGFANQRYFSTVFKQAYGMTPSKYRQEHFS